MKSSITIIIILITGVYLNATQEVTPGQIGLVKSKNDFPALFTRLAEVNKEWEKQQDVPAFVHQIPFVGGDWTLIQTHLMLVEHILRNRDADILSPKLQKARQQNLDNLRKYWQSGAFPINTVCESRIPIFIDPFDNFCAVGYLIKASGNEQLSRHVSARFNYSYLGEMNLPDLTVWAFNSGLTLEELAWIQPTYYRPPYTVFESIGEGFNGVVNVMVSDSVNNHLYVGGRFIEMDGKQNINNIAVCQKDKSGWNSEPLGKGINGIVHAMAFYNGELFVGGEYTNAGKLLVNNVARWDHKQWLDAGSLHGIVYALAVYNGELYAGGDFTGSYESEENFLRPKHFSNFAKWDGKQWVSVGGRFEGTVYALIVHDNHLVIGGEFAHESEVYAKNVVQFNGSEFSDKGSFGYKKEPTIDGSVRCFAVYHDTLYVGGDIENCDSIFGIAKFTGNSWETIFTNRSFRFPIKPNDHIATLTVYNDVLFFGGNFSYGFGHSTYSHNLASYQSSKFEDIGALDAPVYALHSFDGVLFLGGRFKNAVIDGRSWWKRTSNANKKMLNAISHTDLSSRFDK